MWWARILCWDFFDYSCDLSIESTRWMVEMWKVDGSTLLLQSSAKAQCQGSSPTGMTGMTGNIAAVEKRVQILFSDCLCNLPLIIRITSILISKTRLRHMCNYPKASLHWPLYSSYCVSILQSQLDKSILPAFRTSVSVSTIHISQLSHLPNLAR